MKKPNARERILETASELFHRRGYSEVGINEIIAKAETAKASFYQHYPSKEVLCEAWLSHLHERSEAGRKAILESQSSPAEKVEAYFDHLSAFMHESDFRGCPYSNTGAVSDEGCQGIVREIRGHKQSIRDFFHKICREAFSNSERADQIGDRIFLLYSGAAIEAQNLREDWPILAAREAAVEMLA